MQAYLCSQSERPISAVKRPLGGVFHAAFCFMQLHNTLHQIEAKVASAMKAIARFLYAIKGLKMWGNVSSGIAAYVFSMERISLSRWMRIVAPRDSGLNSSRHPFKYPIKLDTLTISAPLYLHTHLVCARLFVWFAIHLTFLGAMFGCLVKRKQLALSA